jgi:hypothetical protein
MKKLPENVTGLFILSMSTVTQIPKDCSVCRTAPFQPFPTRPIPYSFFRQLFPRRLRSFLLYRELQLSPIGHIYRRRGRRALFLSCVATEFIHELLGGSFHDHNVCKRRSFSLKTFKTTLATVLVHYGITWAPNPANFECCAPTRKQSPQEFFTLLVRFLSSMEIARNVLRAT